MVRIGIVGLGFMGMIHYLASVRLKGAKVTAISSRDPKKLAAAIKTRSPSQPVVMLTAYPENLSRENPQAVDLLIGKPFEINALRDAVTRCVPA